jgi:molecular chaperone DnaK (HSP70)
MELPESPELRLVIAIDYGTTYTGISSANGK